MLALGQYLEGQSEQRSTALLKGLMRPGGDSVWVVRDGVEQQLPVEKVQLGDKAVCGAGELIPIDGVVAEASLRKPELHFRRIRARTHPPRRSGHFRFDH